MRGELIYAYDAALTGTVGFGVEFDAILSGAKPIPPQGARFDGGFEGPMTGRIAGHIRGVDHAYMRPDGRLELNLRAVIETADGARIALAAGGVGVLRADAAMIDLSENVTLITAHEAYAWVNARQIWAIGAVDLAAGRVRLEAFLQ